jgi:TatD family-associated radical SAM protein
MTIFYKLYDKLYINLTNRCSCACVFCLRDSGKGVGDADTLWLPHEPSLEEICAAFDAVNISGMTEIVFCGYGEPMERADAVIAACEYIKSKCALPVRLNTNGLVKLIAPDFDMSSLRLFDSVSVSLNADSAEEYVRITQPKFGLESFEIMKNFAREAKEFTAVSFSVVDIIGAERIENCRKIAEDMNIPLRIRGHVTQNEDYT